MNSQQMMGAMCAAALSDEWVLRIQDEIDATPEQLDFCDPEQIGYMDGSEGRACDPLAYGFRTVAECETYIVAWKAIVELQELIDGREDEEFIRWGGN